MSIDPFSYLSVLISIVLGFGITRLLGGIGNLIQERHRVRFYFPSIAQVAVLLLIHVQAWWAMFGLRERTQWDFVAFFVVLMTPIVLYLLAALALPKFSGDGVVDLRANYFSHSRWYFGLFILLVFVSFIRPLAFGDARSLDADAAGHAVFLVIAVAGASTRNDMYHKVTAYISLATVLAYIVLLFGHLK